MVDFKAVGQHCVEEQFAGRAGLLVVRRGEAGTAVAVAFSGNKYELFHFGDRTDGDAARLQPRCAFALFDDMLFLCAFRRNDFSGEFAVRIEIVSFGAPVDAEIMPSVCTLPAIP